MKWQRTKLVCRFFGWIRHRSRMVPVAEQEGMMMLKDDRVVCRQRKPEGRQEMQVTKRLPGRPACLSMGERQSQALEQIARWSCSCIARRPKIRRPYLLKSCWVVPRVDYLVCSFVG